MKHPPVVQKKSTPKPKANASQPVASNGSGLQPPALQLQTAKKGKSSSSSKKTIQKRHHKSVGGVGTSKTETDARNAEIAARVPGLRKDLYGKLPGALNGVVYFKDAGKCTISGGDIKQGKTSLGKITIEKDTATKEAKLNYNYTIGDKTHTGDLISDAFGATHEEKVHHNEYNPDKKGKDKYEDIKESTITTLPGEGSYLKLKSGNEMIYGPGGWIVMKLHKRTKTVGKGKNKKKIKVDDGYHKYGGGKTLDALVEMFGPDDGFDFEELKMLDFMSQVETSGQIAGLNFYDSEYMSIGFTQFTMGGKIQKWFQKNQSSFSKYGIDKMVRPGKKKDFKKHAKQYQSRFWSARFYEAGLDKEIVRAQIKLLHQIDKKKFKRLKDTGITHSALKASILELANNRPVFFEPALKGIKEEKILSTKDGKQTFDNAKLKALLGNLYKYMEIFVGGNLKTAVNKTKDKDDLIKTKSDLKKKLGISKQYAYENIATIKSKISSDTKVKATYKAFWKHIKHEQKGFNMYQKVYNRFEKKKQIAKQQEKFEKKGGKTGGEPAAASLPGKTTVPDSPPTLAPTTSSTEQLTESPAATNQGPSPHLPFPASILATMASATPFPNAAAPMLAAMAAQESLTKKDEEPAPMEAFLNFLRSLFEKKKETG